MTDCAGALLDPAVFYVADGIVPSDCMGEDAVGDIPRNEC